MEKFLQRKFPNYCIHVTPYPKMEWKIDAVVDADYKEIAQAATEWHDINGLEVTFGKVHYDD